MNFFKAKIQVIGVNPYVLLPAAVLKNIFAAAGKNKGAIPVRGTLNGHPFIQTLIKYSGKWRLYLNTPMRKAAGIDVGDIAEVEIGFDPGERMVPLHPKLEEAFRKNKKAKAAFDKLSLSRQKEIMKYINYLKTDESVNKNVQRAIKFLTGGEKFIGQDKR
ncbi:MAG: YdeI/OmpD-associated family protein [Chitinophagaceae bacterium]|nr:YdeI/OmpD-associated family protein [Chitinophagaceae bacterium]